MLSIGFIWFPIPFQLRTAKQACDHVLRQLSSLAKGEGDKEKHGPDAEPSDDDDVELSRLDEAGKKEIRQELRADQASEWPTTETSQRKTPRTLLDAFHLIKKNSKL